MSDAKCGTNAGHNQHQIRGEASCKDCKAANAAYMRAWRRRTGRTRPQPADILQDLIAKLRDEHKYNPQCDWCEPPENPCTDCGIALMVDQAEQLLREVQGE